MSALQPWTADFQGRMASAPGFGAPWLTALRRRAIERFADEGWPTPKNENWRHTSLAVLAQQEFSAAPAAATAAGQVRALRQGEDGGHWLVFVDGRHAPELSEVGSLPDGATIASLSQQLASAPEQVEPYFGGEQDGESTAALNMAFASDGAFIHLAAGIELEQPVHLVFVTAGAPVASFPRNLVVALAGARATVVEHYLGEGGGSTLTNVVTRVHVGVDADITHFKLQQESKDAFHLARIDAAQERNSVFNSHSMSFGARLARNDINTRFNGARCETLLNGLYYVDGKRHVDHHTGVDHAHPFGVSREYYRGILTDAARGVFTGRILVAPGADRTDAVQRTDSLLLSRLAKADARPELEIYADDVKCAHGATIGQLDETSLFYLRTRGLTQAHARGLLTYAFAAQALERISLEPLRRRAALAIRSLLPSGESLGELA